MPFGNTRLEISYDKVNNWIYANWIGVHSFESIRQGAQELLEVFTLAPTAKYLNDNTHILGAWDTANSWLAQEWIPAVVNAGIKHVAHVVSPGIYGEESIKALLPLIPVNLNLMLFDNLEEASDWLANQA